MKKEEFCDGCCYRVTCDHDLEKCCYMVGNLCIAQQREFKMRMKKW